MLRDNGYGADTSKATSEAAVGLQGSKCSGGGPTAPSGKLAPAIGMPASEGNFFRNLEAQLAARRDAAQLAACPSEARPSAENLTKPARNVASTWLSAGIVTAALTVISAVWWLPHAERGGANVPRMATTETALAVSLAEAARMLQQERARADALAGELAIAWTILKSQTAELAGKAWVGEELGTLRQALQQAQAAAKSAFDLLAQERDRSDELANQLADQVAARSIGPEVDSELESLRLAVRQAQTSTRHALDLLTQERGRSEELAAELADRMAARSLEGHAAPTAAGPVAPLVSVAVTDLLAHEPSPARAPTAHDSPEPTTDTVPLMKRASVLIGQGNIGAARVVLEHAAEPGSAAALYSLAETYDPVALAKWGAVGTQPDVAKARDLYAQALAAGVLEARARLLALP